MAGKQLVGVLHAERRAAPRYTVDLKVLFVIEGLVAQARAEDLSMTGMRMVSEVELDVGTRIDARFAPTGELVTHVLSGVIVWSRPSDAEPDKFVQGLHFDPLSKQTGERLAELIREAEAAVEDGDLPLVDDEAVVEVTEPGAATPPADLRFAPISEPLGLGASPDLEGHGDGWSVSQTLQAALAEDHQRREQKRQRAKTLSQQARNAQRRGAHADALSLLREAADLLPDSDTVLEELAEAVYLHGDAREAARLFDRALRLRMERKG